MGKAEGEKELWHGHVSALTVAPVYRRMGLAKMLMDILEQVSEKMCYNSYPVITATLWTCLCGSQIRLPY